MLKHIPDLLSPDVLKILMEMGHGDELVIADGNFPAASLAQRLVRLDGHSGTDVLKAILTLFPLDSYDKNIFLMEKVPNDTAETPIWKTYEEIASKGDPNFSSLHFLDRFAFYERAQKAYAIVATGEKALYANIILKKGVVTSC